MKSPFVKDWMTTNPIAIFPYSSLSEANHLMCVHDARTLPIINDQNFLVGIITRRDLLRFDSSLDLNITQSVFTGIDHLNVERIMTINPVTVTPNQTLKFAAKTMLERKFNALPVLDKTKKLIGILTTPDIFRFLLSSIENLKISYPVKRIMKTNLLVLHPDSTLAEARKNMFERKIRSIPILEDSKLVGIVTRTDLLRAIPSALTGPAKENETSGIEETPIHYIMTSRPLTVSTSTLVPETAEIMLKYQIHSLPILDKKENLVGIITETDLFSLVVNSIN